MSHEDPEEMVLRRAVDQARQQLNDSYFERYGHYDAPKKSSEKAATALASGILQFSESSDVLKASMANVSVSLGLFTRDDLAQFEDESALNALMSKRVEELEALEAALTAVVKNARAVRDISYWIKWRKDAKELIASRMEEQDEKRLKRKIKEAAKVDKQPGKKDRERERAHGDREK